MPVRKRFDLFWRQARVSNAWKLQVFHAVCISKLLGGSAADGSHSSQIRYIPTKGPQKHIEHVHKLHRSSKDKSRNIQTCQWNHGCTSKHVRPLTKILQEKKKQKRLGHIIRRPCDHTHHQATFATRSLVPQKAEQHRVGRPRLIMKQCWLKRNQQTPFDIQNREIGNQIWQWAFNREEPF